MRFYNQGQNEMSVEISEQSSYFTEGYKLSQSSISGNSVSRKSTSVNFKGLKVAIPIALSLTSPIPLVSSRPLDAINGVMQESSTSNFLNLGIYTNMKSMENFDMNKGEQIAVNSTDIEHLKKSVDEIKSTMVTKDYLSSELKSVKLWIFAGVVGILITIIQNIIA